MNQRRILGQSCALIAVSLAIHASSSPLSDSFFGIGDLPGNGYGSLARAATLNGQTVVGDSLADEPNIPDDYEGEAFVWQRSTGIGGLGYLPPIPGSAFNISSVAYAISSDGSVAAGDSRYELPTNPGSGEHEAVLWLRSASTGELAGPPLALGFLPGGDRSAAFGASHGGGVITGYSRMLVGPTVLDRAFVWTDPSAGGNGMQLLDPGDPSANSSRAGDISDDGSIAVGFVQAMPDQSAYRACIWSSGSNGFTLHLLPDPPDTAHGSYAASVSGDGSVVVGARTTAGDTQRACRWERAGANTLSDAQSAITGWKAEVLGVLPNDEWSIVSLPGHSVSFDGAVVVGISGHDVKETAFVWDRDHKMRRVADVLTLSGITAHQGWNLAEAWGVSGDASHGYTIVGGGTNPNGDFEGWVAHVDARWL